MSQQQPVIQNQPSQQPQLTIEQLKDSIHLSANKLLQLTYSQQKYINTIVKFNNQAIQHIDKQQQQQALVYLAEAERTLQYGASCGKSIDRNLIISILNNQACCYYRQGQLNKCASYLEGVIYNLKAFGTSMETSPAGSSLLQKNRLKNIDQFYHISLQKKVQLVHYSLRYCTINSQLAKRQLALKAGTNVVRLVKSLFYDIIFENPKLFALQQIKKQQQLKQLKDLIKQITFFKEQIQVDQIQIYRKLTRIYVKKWNQRKINNRINRDFQKYIRDYSISQVIDIVPTYYVSNTDSIYQALANTKVILRQLLHLSMGYFTISTQHRLLAQHRYPSSLQQKHQSQQWKSANIYHLLGILFLGINLNSDLLFMKQLISSYQQHYKYQLLLQQHLPDQQLQSLSQKLLFQTKRQKNSKQQSQILFQKISKLKQKQQKKGSVIKQVKKTNKSKSKDTQYKTLNNTKLNISKEITPQVQRKRSISKQQTSALSSSKKLSQKNSMNNSAVNKTKLLHDTQNNDKLPSRKRSYSKDSIKQTKKPIGHLGVDKFNQAQKTANQYQLETPSKKPLQGQKKRRISSVSSGKEIVLQSNRQSSKNAKFMTSNDKQRKLHFESQRVKSPAVKLVKGKTQKGKQKQTQKEHKTKKKVMQKVQKQKQVKKKKTSQKPYYYF